MTESQFYNRIKKELKPAPERLMLQRIEAQCVPDIFYSTIHGQGWIELKVEPKQSTLVKIAFRRGQFMWLNQYLSLGQTAFLFLALNTVDGYHLFIFRNYDIHHAYVQPPTDYNKTFPEFMGIHQCAKYHAPLNKVDWDKVHLILEDKH